MRMRVMWAKALLGRMEAGGGVDVVDVVADVGTVVRLRRKRPRLRRFCRKWRRLSSLGTKSVRRVKIADRARTVEAVMAAEIAVEGMIAETVGGVMAGVIVSQRVRIVEALNLNQADRSRSRLFCRASRFRSIGVEKMVRRKLWLPNLRRPM
jgi:hypothetical protein